ncbi:MULTISPECIES: hypothetical protein [unclassified Chryseobacterium]|uniref:hypothetical protein n=1 Tax=unclassified Chryseobacterium TaxID=2593645 RepID=UPI000A95030E|nr:MULTISPECIES: hypothetical protein [unclassified Chryseobacterium]
MKKIFLLTLCTVILISCQKTKKMKDKLFPERPYEEANIDKFYWSDSGWDYTMVPLIKPFQLIKLQGSKDWELSTGFNRFGEIGVYNINSFNVNKYYIYGHKASEINESDSNYNIVEYWYIIDLRKGVKIEDSALVKLDKESDFQAKLKELNLPETFLNPDEVYEQYKQNPVLLWFPEDIKKQLEEINKQK